MGAERQGKIRGSAAWASGVLGCACAILLSLLLPGPSAAGSRWGKDYLPNVEVLDQNSRPLRFYDDLIHGRIVVISFVYTSCNSICPLTVARLAEVQDKLADVMGRDIHFVSVSIDPIPDTPEKLKEHEKAFGVGPGWTFVTGSIENIDLIRYKLGERSGKAINQHKNEILLYNDTTGEWLRDSAFVDLGVLELTIRGMDPKVRYAAKSPAESLPIALAGAAQEGPGQALFIKACASCHSIGKGTKIGPDLAGIQSRREHEWIEAYLTAPNRLRKAGDPAALELREKFPAVRMPNLSLSADDISDLLTYIAAKTPREAAN